MGININVVVSDISVLINQIEAQPQSQVNTAEFFNGDEPSAAQEACFFNGHNLFTFHVGVIGQTVLFRGGNAHMERQFTLGTTHGGDDGEWIR